MRGLRGSRSDALPGCQQLNSGILERGLPAALDLVKVLRLDRGASCL